MMNISSYHIFYRGPFSCVEHLVNEPFKPVVHAPGGVPPAEPAPQNCWLPLWLHSLQKNGGSLGTKPIYYHLLVYAACLKLITYISIFPERIMIVSAHTTLNPKIEMQPTAAN